jgi:APA family basic amino acid/polyamine antiporter
MALEVLCFAEEASRFSTTGGPFVYASAAFGPFVGFLTGWVLLFAAYCFSTCLIGTPAQRHFAEAVLLLGFAFVGWESVVVAAGETRSPQGDLPPALLGGLGAVTILYLLIQVVCIGTLPQLAESQHPLVDAIRVILGPAGAILITLGAVAAMVGTLNGALLTISRLLYAMAGESHLGLVAALHPRFRTPHVAVVISGILVFGLTVSGEFVYLLTVSTISRLMAFAVTCAALPRLRRVSDAPQVCFALPGDGPSPERRSR